MSNFRFNRLESYRSGGTPDEMELTIPLPKTPSGKTLRCCPVNSCIPSLFQLGDTPPKQNISEEHASLIRRTPGTSGITCPYCGCDSPDDECVCEQDIEAAMEYLTWAVEQDTRDFFEKTSRDFNRKMKQHKNPFFSIEMGMKTPPKRSHPITWRDDLLRDITCDICERQYGVYAIALFCPDCGARNLHVHFQREIELINQQLELAKTVERDKNRELANRLLGNAHEDVLTAFETYLKTIYKFLVKQRLPEDFDKLCSKKAIGNSFQNVERGRKLFKKIEIDPYKLLTEDEVNFLVLNIQKRHVLGHNLGMADEAYIEIDQAEQPGQTVRLLVEEISRFATICDTIIRFLEENCDEFLPHLL